ncbi:MAG: DUF302 domain-containing protein, partial [Alphaproteobacteria bacterium]
MGACNPPNVLKALQQEDKIGTMLPCNVIVQENGENQVEIAAIDPNAPMMAVFLNERYARGAIDKEEYEMKK